MAGLNKQPSSGPIESGEKLSSYESKCARELGVHPFCDSNVALGEIRGVTFERKVEVTRRKQSALPLFRVALATLLFCMWLNPILTYTLSFIGFCVTQTWAYALCPWLVVLHACKTLKPPRSAGFFSNMDNPVFKKQVVSKAGMCPDISLENSDDSPSFEYAKYTLTACNMDWVIFSELDPKYMSTETSWAMGIEKNHLLISVPGLDNKCVFYAHAFCTGRIQAGQADIPYTNYHPMFNGFDYDPAEGTTNRSAIENIGALYFPNMEEWRTAVYKNDPRLEFMRVVLIGEFKHAYVTMPRGKRMLELIGEYKDYVARVKAGKILRCMGIYDARFGAKSSFKSTFGKDPVKATFTPPKKLKQKVPELAQLQTYATPEEVHHSEKHPVIVAKYDGDVAEYHWPLRYPCAVLAVAYARMAQITPHCEDLVPLVTATLHPNGKTNGYIDFDDDELPFIEDGEQSKTVQVLGEDFLKKSSDYVRKKLDMPAKDFSYDQFVEYLNHAGIPISDGRTVGVRIYKLYASKGFHATYVGRRPVREQVYKVDNSNLRTPQYLRFLRMFDTKEFETISRVYDALGEKVLLLRDGVVMATNTTYGGYKSIFTYIDVVDRKCIVEKFDPLKHAPKKSTTSYQPLQNDDSIISDEPVVLYTAKSTLLNQDASVDNICLTINSSRSKDSFELGKTPKMREHESHISYDTNDSDGVERHYVVRQGDFALSLDAGDSVRLPQIDEESTSEEAVIFLTKNIQAALNDCKCDNLIGKNLPIKLSDRFAVLEFPRTTGHYTLFSEDQNYSYLAVEVKHHQVTYNCVLSAYATWSAVHHSLPYRATQYTYIEDGENSLVFNQYRRYAVGNMVNLVVYDCKVGSPQPTVVDGQGYLERPIWYDPKRQIPGANLGSFSQTTLSAINSMWIVIPDNYKKVLSPDPVVSDSAFLSAFNFAKVIDKNLKDGCTPGFVAMVRYYANRYRDYQCVEPPKNRSIFKVVRAFRQQLKYKHKVQHIATNYGLGRLAKYYPEMAEDMLYQLFYLQHFDKIVALIIGIWFGMVGLMGTMRVITDYLVAYAVVSGATSCIVLLVFRHMIFVNWRTLYKRFVSLERSVSCNVCWLQNQNCVFCDHSTLTQRKVRGEHLPYVSFEQVECAVDRKRWFPMMLPRSSLDDLYGKSRWYNFRKIELGPWFKNMNAYFDWCKQQPVKVTKGFRQSLLGKELKHIDPVSVEDTKVGGAWAMFKRQGARLMKPDPKYLDSLGMGVIDEKLWVRAQLEIEIPTFAQYLKQVPSEKRAKYQQSYERFLSGKKIQAKYSAFVKIGENGPYNKSRKNRNIANPDDSILGVGGYMNHLVIKTTKRYIELLFAEHPYFSSWEEGRKQTFFVHAMKPSDLERAILEAARSIAALSKTLPA